MWFIFIVIVVVAYLYIRKKKDEQPNYESPKPPTKDVYMLGCNWDCGYFVPDLEAGNGMVYCKYQGKTVRRGSDCPFKDAHRDQLREGTAFAE